MKRIVIFLDSNNFHNGSKNLLGIPSPKFSWANLLLGINKEYINFQKMIGGDIDCNLVQVYYYSALSSPNDNPTMYSKQKNFLDAIAKIHFITVKTGFLMKTTQADGSIKRIEKQTDTMISNDIITHAYTNAYDVGILISGDADFCGAVEIAKNQGKEIVLCNPVGTVAVQLSKLCEPNIIYLDDKFLRGHLLNSGR